MSLIKKLIFLPFMLLCFYTIAGESSIDFQKVCSIEQKKQHKAVLGNTLEVYDFKEYCKCEADYIVKKATKDQLNQISNNQTSTPKWLSRLRSKALDNCLLQEKKITT